MKQHRQTACFFILFGFIAAFAPTLRAQNWNQIIKAVASDRSATASFGYSVAISGDYAIVGASYDVGSAYIFKRTGTNWVQEAKIVASDGASNDFFGNSVAISGDYAVVGALYESENATGGNTLSQAGSAYIFKRTGTSWAQEEAKIVASDRAAGDRFGNSVAISGDYVIVGAFAKTENATGGSTAVLAGSAYIFKRTGTSWAQEAKIVASDRAEVDQFGYSVAISGDYAVVGAYAEDHNATGGSMLTDAGSAYIFKRTGTTWAQEAKIVATDRAADDQFGWSSAISGDYVIVGAFTEDHNAAGGSALTDAGSAYIFKRTGTTWAQEAKIVASDRAAGDVFGNSVGISGDYAIVGASSVTGGGASYTFKRTGTSWAQQAKIVASDRAADDYFGISVAISAGYVVVGAYNEDEDATGGNTLTDAGSAYFFKSPPVWTGAVSTDWSNDANWLPTYAPGSLENITIPTTTNIPTLSAAQTVASLSFTGSNKVVLGNNNLTVGALTGGSSSNYVVTNGTGSFTINNVGTSAKLFPVGPSTTQYAPVTITNSVNRNFTVKVGNTVSNPVSGYRYVNHQWDITPSVLTGNSATLAFGWSSSAQAATFNPAQSVQINHYNTTSNTWDASFSATVSGSNPYTATTSGITVFSPFSATNVTVLPVEVLSFEGKNTEVRNPATGGTEGGNFLTWQTANEVNNKGFQIERRQVTTDTWDAIGFVAANNKASNYQFLDDRRDGKFSVSTTTDYYRLRQIDKDGKETLSKVVSIQSKGNDKLKVYPNPVSHQLTIETEVKGDYHIFNLLGQVVLSARTPSERGPAATQQIDVSALPKGSYVLKVGEEQARFNKLN